MMSQIKGATVHHGDCIESMKIYAGMDVQFDSCVCDPPYHLASVVKRFGAANAAPAQHGTDGAYARASKGFMGQSWDGGDISFDPDTWRAVYDVLKPGAHLVVFGGTKSFHRIACAIEDAGFELRDTLMWIYGSGFPKSHDVSKGIDKGFGVTGHIVPTGGEVKRMIPGADQNNDGSWIKDNGRTYQPGEYEPASDQAAQWQGWGTALKPAFEPIILARKPLIGTVAANVLQFGTGAINIDGCRVGTETRTNSSAPQAERNGFVKGFVTGTETITHDHGRWPANVILDGSDEVIDAFPTTTSGALQPWHSLTESENGSMSGKNYDRNPRQSFGGDTGSAARFFYHAKANAKDRAGSKHPTVKPIDLIRYLMRLVTPPGGVVLDCFAGSGSAGEAAELEGFKSVLMEQSAEYYADICNRMNGLAA